jgi:hypothetical protein
MMRTLCTFTPPGAGHSSRGRVAIGKRRKARRDEVRGRRSAVKGICEMDKRVRWDCPRRTTCGLESTNLCRTGRPLRATARHPARGKRVIYGLQTAGIPSTVDMVGYGGRQRQRFEVGKAEMVRVPTVLARGLGIASVTERTCLPTGTVLACR